jgi:hypothetical protein
MRDVLVLAAIAFAVAVPTSTAQPSDVLVDEPDSHRLVVENDYVRVSEIQLAPGMVLPMQARPPALS